MRKHPLADRVERSSDENILAFFKKIGEADTCWEWNAAKTDKGYGQTTYKGKIVYAHRLAYSLIDEDFDIFDSSVLVLHHCDNPSCVRPNHLFKGDHSDNRWDQIVKGRDGSKGSPGEDHGMSKLTEIEVLEIRRIYALGNWSYADLATEYNVGWTTIQKIVKRTTWKHV